MLLMMSFLQIKVDGGKCVKSFLRQFPRRHLAELPERKSP